jgi:hypothetical protein
VFTFSPSSVATLISAILFPLAAVVIYLVFGVIAMVQRNGFEAEERDIVVQRYAENSVRLMLCSAASFSIAFLSVRLHLVGFSVLCVVAALFMALTSASLALLGKGPGKLTVVAGHSLLLLVAVGMAVWIATAR